MPFHVRIFLAALGICLSLSINAASKASRLSSCFMYQVSHVTDHTLGYRFLDPIKIKFYMPRLNARYLNVASFKGNNWRENNIETSFTDFTFVISIYKVKRKVKEIIFFMRIATSRKKRRHFYKNLQPIEAGNSGNNFYWSACIETYICL